MKAMILAAGLGTRMRPLTDHTPKPLLKAGGKMLIDYHIEALREAGLTELVINTAWLGEQIEAALGDGASRGVTIEYSREGSPLETAGGIRRALPLLGDASFAVINGDIWSDFDYRHLRIDPPGVAHLVLVDNPQHNPDGDFALAADGKVTDNGPAALTFAGIGVYRPSLFSGLDEGEAKLAPLLREAMAEGRVSGEHHRGRWFDIGTPQRLDELDRILRNPDGQS